MPYLIDGHNLIPKVGLRLDSPDDEMELVAILQEFARLKRQQVEVYFDGAPIGYDGARSMGTVRAHFVSSEEFVKILRTAVSSAPKANAVDKKLSPAEVDEWLKIFRDKGR